MVVMPRAAWTGHGLDGLAGECPVIAPGVAQAEVDVVVPVDAGEVRTGRLGDEGGNGLDQRVIQLIGTPSSKWARARSKSSRDLGWRATKTSSSRTLSAASRSRSMVAVKGDLRGLAASLGYPTNSFARSTALPASAA